MIHVFRRFIEGGVSVYLFIFMVTLFVRLFLFDTRNHTPAPAAAWLRSELKAEYPLHAGIESAVSSVKFDVAYHNRRFGQENEPSSN